MSQDLGASSLLKEAEKQERKYCWFEAARLYEKVLHSESGNAPSAAETWEKIGVCYCWASRQTEDLEEFRKLRQLAVEAYKNAAKHFEEESGLKNRGKSAQCNAVAKYSSSWLASDPSEKKKMLDECRKFGNEALEAQKNAGDEMGYGNTCIILLLCLFERLYIVSDAREQQIIAREGIDCGNKAILTLSRLENKNGLLLGYSIASLQNWYASNISEEEKEGKELASRSLSYSEKALALSKDVDSPYHTAMSLWAAAFSTLFFTGKIETSLEYAKQMLQQGLLVRDNYIEGIACYVLAQITDWMIHGETNPDKKKQRCTEIIEYAEKAISSLELVSQDFFMAETYSLCAEGHSLLARNIGAQIEEKRALLKKATEIGRKGVEHAFRSGSPDATGSTLHALSKSLHFYSNFEPERDEKTKLLGEALTLRKEYVTLVEKTFPSNDWILGVGNYYAGLIEAELAKLETDEKQKITLLRNAVSDMEKGVAHCKKWTSSRPTPSLLAMVAGFEDTFGTGLNELFLLTKEDEALTKAIEVHNDAAGKFKEVGLPTRAAESYWKIGKNQDLLGEHQEAAKSFENAFAEYKAATQRFPQFADFYQDYAVYTKAWSEIETAKSTHKNQEYNIATEHYEKAANYLKQTKLWSYLSSNFHAWSLLEQAEDSSRKEKSSNSTEAFKKATQLFHEAQETIQAELSRIENADEKDLAKRLIEASNTREKYCLGRIAVEEARILDRQGDHDASSRKYGFAAETFQEIAEAESYQTRKELKPLISLCQAWRKMMMAEAKASPVMYEEAAELFKQASEYAPDQPTSLLALAHSSFCRALEAATEFEITRDVIMCSTARKQMEAAGNYYLRAGFETGSEYSKGMQRLFDAYIFMDDGKNEADPEKEARYYTMAEKVLQISAESFAKAQHTEKTEQVQRLLEKVKQERELAVSLSEVLHAPTTTSSTASFAALTPNEETAVGLERFEHADIQARLVEIEKEIKVGEDFKLEMQIVNVGKEAVLLDRIEEILPAGFQLIAKPDYTYFEDTHLNLKGKRLDPLKTEDVGLVLRPLRKGTLEIRPRIVCIDETGHQMLRGLEPVTTTVSEATLPDRITTGYDDLDSLLFGGIPENYAVILTSPSCDERDLLIKRYLEDGVKKGQITFFVTTEASRIKTLAKNFQSNFYLFICNPKADMMIESFPNVFKLKGVENLTDIEIALTKALRGLDETPSGPRRACIEIISDVLLRHRPVSTRGWLAGLIPDLRSKGFTTMAVMNPLMHPSEETQAILSLFEGEISIYERETERGSEKLLRIRKMYNQKYVDSALPLNKLELES
jgi:KaiC/GvpD/RAD55 family RecA-like ATPase